MTYRDEPVYEIFALRHGTHADRPAHENFLFGPGGVDRTATMPLDFYIWVIRNENHVLLVDTGFSPEAAARRGRTVLSSPVDGLLALGLRPAEISDIVITHMHYDHIGNVDRFPSARLHVQEAELDFCTGRAMSHETIRKPFESTDVTTVVDKLFTGQVVLHRGDFEFAPGVTVHQLGGHTPGLQVVRVRTRRGWVVLASDATHLWANIRLRKPFPIVHDLTSTFEAYDTIEALADGRDHVIPGHDPEVARLFPRLPQAPEWVCLHEAPAATLVRPVAEIGAAR